MAKFKTRARAVDMLGRQQIADVSTAISELFKNAHDAYAEHVEVDYFKSDDILVIRDDGIGMTKEEFENRWLVLGTESKLDSESHNATFKPPKKHSRAIMGEKGIGRLAIALLGTQVLVLTRAQRNNGLSDLSMCYIHWGLFEIPSLNLDDLDFPVVSIPGGTLPSEDDVNALVKQNYSFVESLKQNIPQYAFQHILEDMKNFLVDPIDLDDFLAGISLRNSGTGTHFLIAPANEELKEEIERERKSKTREFSKCLLGFCNSTFCTDSNPPIKTAFRYWPSDISHEDLIGSQEFFTKLDLNCADQYVRGRINDYGQFQGTVKVYEQEYMDHIISWSNNTGKPTLCGPFDIEFGYLQAVQRESKADPEDFNRLRGKLDHISGLYVYRDGVRIVPYGNSDIDWLDIELRRTKGAGYYFFSYRNVYGAVCLTRENNGNLKEKAGREGFQKDKAYRQLKEILENLFIQLATDFFRKDADLGDYFNERKAELDRLERARRKREKQVGTKRKKLSLALDSFFNSISQQLPEAEIDSLRLQVHAQMESASRKSNPDEVAEELLEAENDANSRLAAIRQSYQIVKPRGVGLTKLLDRDWTAYKREQERLGTELFSPLSKEVAETLGKVAEEARVYIDQRRRLKDLIKQVSDARESEVKAEAKMLKESATETRRIAINAARNAIQDFRNIVSKVETDFNEQDFADVDPQHAEDIRQMYELRIEEVGQRNSESLGKVREMLTSISENFERSPDIGQLDMVEAMDKELQTLKEQADTDAELVQLGLAVAVINHEFEAAIKGIRSKLRELGSWARANDDLIPLYQSIRTNFDHLDAHLNLFTPLQRRLQRKKTIIRGSEINHYVRTLFSVRLTRHDIQMDVTPKFINSAISTFPSTIYPVFVNIIDNAVFWLKDIQKPRKIVLDFSDNAYLIGNNGPAINKKDFEAIFEQGFSRKPGGRGLGLFISRKVLDKERLSLSLMPNPNDGFGTTFKINCEREDHD